MGQFTQKILWKHIQHVQTAHLFLPGMAAAAPIEDTPEVAEAKATFKAAFDAAEAGEHAALRPDALHPVNNDVQAPQIASAYLDDVEEVAAAKAEFQAAFDDAAAGFPIHGLGYAGIPYAAGLVHHGLAYNTIGYHGLGFPYAGLPVVAAAAPAAEE